MNDDSAAQTTKTAGDLRRTARANKIHNIYVFSGTNLGRFTLTARMSIRDFYDMSVVANKETVAQKEYEGQPVAQRKLIPAHAKGLALYVLRGLVISAILARRQQGSAIQEEVIRIRDDLAGGPYAALQPIVCNIRNCKPEGEDLPMDYAAKEGLPFFAVSLTASQKLWVVDGQHRREAFGIVIKYLEDLVKNGSYPKSKNSLYSPVGDEKINKVAMQFWNEVFDLALNECSVTVEIHTGLGLLEEGQLFADLNSRGKNLSASLLSQFNKSDAIAAMTVESLIGADDPVIKFPVRDESDTKNWDDAGFPLKDIIMINRILVTGSGSVKDIPPTMASGALTFVQKFWRVVQSIQGFGEESHRSKTVAGQPVVLKALAKLAYDHAYGVPRLRDGDGLKRLYDAILSEELSFSHSEPLWTALFMDDQQRAKTFTAPAGINDYVYLGDQFKGGEFSNGLVRYGTAHNDIFPRIGDLIRWKLGLRNRGAAAKARAGAAEAEDDA
jgi:hypothetical protein